VGASGVEVRVADAGEEQPADAESYDRVLVDPPCSDLGTLASRPDARWRKDPDLIARVAREQRRILAAGIAAVRPGGALVYSTCTISRTENEDVVDAALALHPELSEAQRRSFRPDTDGTDGFFISLLRKRTE
jgi:16S rRNA (cytosine967-C5)-methyltransferase